jgi:hypothetical protein
VRPPAIADLTRTMPQRTNAAYAADLAAMALGVTRGADEHTPQECIETGPVGQGLLVLADTIRRFREASE